MLYNQTTPGGTCYGAKDGALASTWIGGVAPTAKGDMAIINGCAVAWGAGDMNNVTLPFNVTADSGSAVSFGGIAGVRAFSGVGIFQGVCQHLNGDVLGVVFASGNSLVDGSYAGISIVGMLVIVSGSLRCIDNVINYGSVITDPSTTAYFHVFNNASECDFSGSVLYDTSNGGSDIVVRSGGNFTTVGSCVLDGTIRVETGAAFTKGSGTTIVGVCIGYSGSTVPAGSVLLACTKQTGDTIAAYAAGQAAGGGLGKLGGMGLGI